MSAEDPLGKLFDAEFAKVMTKEEASMKSALSRFNAGTSLLTQEVISEVMKKNITAGMQAYTAIEDGMKVLQAISAMVDSFDSLNTAKISDEAFMAKSTEALELIKQWQPVMKDLLQGQSYFLQNIDSAWMPEGSTQEDLDAALAASNAAILQLDTREIFGGLTVAEIAKSTLEDRAGSAPSTS